MLCHRMKSTFLLLLFAVRQSSFPMSTTPMKPSRVALHDMGDDPPFLVVQYIDGFHDRLDARRFLAMCLPRSYRLFTMHLIGVKVIRL